MRFDVLLTEERLEREFLEALRARSLPEKFFYWFPLSVRAWRDLCSPGEYRNFSRSFGLLRASAGAIAAALGPGPVEVVSLGAGDAGKDLLLLEALERSGGAPRYLAVDASQGLLETACAATERFSGSGLKADLTDPAHLAEVRARAGEAPRLFLLVGNTLGGLDPPRAIEAFGLLLRPQDRLLVDGEIPGPDTMAGYDNPTNRRFAFAPLRSLGLSEEDGAIVFEREADPRLPGLERIAKHFRPARELRLRPGGESLRLGPGERLEMSPSYKYARPAFLGLLRDAGRLEPLLVRDAEDGRFVAALCGPAR
ncbi:MAG TPA: L-histidine N(alpha)-methyltransferase [Planctomycetota bacterium]|nr:L-histidine N(alpha)-methyltransferase [Planctomycetota bacterium]